MEIDFTAKKHVQGRITNYRTAHTLEFMLNPEKIIYGKSANQSDDSMPGRADPLIRWASGGVSSISFQLKLDGYIGNWKRGRPFQNSAVPGTPHYLSVQGDLDFLESFMFPVDPSIPGSDGGPDKLVFTFGSQFPGVVCTMDSFSAEVTAYTPKLEPMRATVSLSLKRYVTTNRFAHTIWSP